jgi:hypothetical protein
MTIFMTDEMLKGIMATSFSGGKSRSTRKEPPTMGKQLVSFLTCGCESSAPFFVIYKAGRKPPQYWWPVCPIYNYERPGQIRFIYLQFIYVFRGNVFHLGMEFVST